MTPSTHSTVIHSQQYVATPSLSVFSPHPNDLAYKAKIGKATANNKPEIPLD